MYSNDTSTSDLDPGGFKEYLGKILKDKDPLLQGQYLVHIPDLMPHEDETNGIWCKNHSYDNRISTSDVGMCGGYHPLQPGMQVLVRLFDKDPNTGYIVRVVSDHEENSQAFKSVDRDDIYLMMRTPKYNNVICINEDTQDQPKNSIQIIYNKTKTFITIDEKGVHIETENDIGIHSKGETRIQADGKIYLNSGAPEVPKTTNFEKEEEKKKES